MNRRTLVALVASALVVSLAALVACGDEGEVPAGPDAGGPGADPKSDADAQLDGASSSPTDGGTPGSLSDASDGGPSALALYPAALAEALCSSLTRCCFGNPNVPDGGAVARLGLSGSYDKAACLERFREGFESSNRGQEAFPWGTVTLDEAKAKDCLAKIGALSCSVGAAEFAAARTACFEAVVGKQGAGQPCRSSMECGKGLFCRPNSPAVVDGGVSGACEALVADGGDCGFFQEDNALASVRGQEACSWRASGDTKLHCESYNPAFVQTVLYPSRSVWKCRPALSGEDHCRSTADCASGMCDAQDKKCGAPMPYFDVPSSIVICADVVKP